MTRHVAQLYAMLYCPYRLLTGWITSNAMGLVHLNSRVGGSERASPVSDGSFITRPNLVS